MKYSLEVLSPVHIGSGEKYTSAEFIIQKDTLMHEWAHCITEWNIEGDSHTDTWGVNYARIYRQMVGD